MKTLSRGAAICAVALAAVVLASIAFAQEARPPKDEWYGEAKRVLMSHYVGKTVRARLPIPATRRGLEMVDGALQSSSTPAATPAAPQFAAQPGDELTIKSFKANDHDIALVFNKTGAQPERARWNPFAAPKQPRLKLRFSRELTGKDLTIENINRWLAAAIDVSPLAPLATTTAEVAPVAEKSTNGAPTAPTSPEPVRQTVSLNESSPLPTLPVIGELPELGPNVGELTIEYSDRQARIYIDESYSGLAPRTVRLRAGVHTVSVLRDGKLIWEQRLFVPGGKASVLRVAANEAVKR